MKAGDIDTVKFSRSGVSAKSTALPQEPSDWSQAWP